MSRILTDQELEDILNDPEPSSLLGFEKYVFARKVDLYSFYLIRRFEKIDEDYSSKKQENDNKGKKGELLMCGIIDLTMWRLGLRLGKDYTVTRAKRGKKGVDFKLTCLKTAFLCEAKNWAEKTWIDERTYDKKIRTRFSDDGINILMILRDKVSDVEDMYKKYSTDNGHPINYIEIDHFMDAKSNDVYHINLNLLYGIKQFYNYMMKYTEMDRDFSLVECLQIGMPNWFILDYLEVNKRTITRWSKKLKLNRRSAKYRKLVRYRDIR